LTDEIALFIVEALLGQARQTATQELTTHNDVSELNPTSEALVVDPDQLGEGFPFETTALKRIEQESS
jgi:hypothetical protein